MMQQSLIIDDIIQCSCVIRQSQNRKYQLFTVTNQKENEHYCLLRNLKFLGNATLSKISIIITIIK